MTLVTPRIVNSVSCVKRIDHDRIAGARNVVFFNTKCSWWA